MIDLKLVQEIVELEHIESNTNEEVFDFSAPEDVLIEVVGPHDDNGPTDDWKNFSMETCHVIRGKEGVTGAASYDASYGGFLDYTLQNMIDVPGVGWFVVEGITGEYHKGDGWMTDDDMTFEFKTVRPATDEDMKLL